MKPTLFALLVSALACTPAAAQSVNLVVGYPPGASYDIYMRTLARHLGKHLPGNPTVVPQNMAGAGSLRAANFLFNTAPKDGNTIGMFARGLAMQPLLDATGIQYEARKFNWIGSLTSDVSMVLSWHTRPFKTLDDARQREMIVAGTGSGADSVIFPYILNGVLGTKFKVVTGYPGATDFLLAVERGEADGTAGVSWSSITAGKADWISGKRINLLVQLGMKKHPDMGATPLVMDYAKTDSDRGVLELIFARQDMAYPVVAPPDVPAERIAVLRKRVRGGDEGPRLSRRRQEAAPRDRFHARREHRQADRAHLCAARPRSIARARTALEDGKKVTTKR